MANVQVRLPDELEAALAGLADELHGTRSDAIRHALAEGLQAHRERKALQDYVAGDVSLEGAATAAGIGLHAMALRARDAGVAYMRYPADELDEDLAALD